MAKEDFIQKGIEFSRQGNYQDALAAYDSAIQADPTDSIGYVNRADALNHLGRYSEALASFDFAINKVSNFWGVSRQEANYYAVSTYLTTVENFGTEGHIDESIERLERLYDSVSYDPDKDTYQSQAHANKLYVGFLTAKTLGNILEDRLTANNYDMSQIKWEWLDKWLIMLGRGLPASRDRVNAMLLPFGEKSPPDYGFRFDEGYGSDENIAQVGKFYSILDKIARVNFPQNGYSVYTLIDRVLNYSHENQYLICSARRNLINIVNLWQKAGGVVTAKMLDNIDFSLDVDSRRERPHYFLSFAVGDWGGYVANPNDSRNKEALPALTYLNILTRLWHTDPQRRNEVEYHLRRIMKISQNWEGDKYDLRSAMGLLAASTLQRLYADDLFNPSPNQATSFTEAQVRQIVNDAIATNKTILELQQNGLVQADKLRDLMEAVAKTRVTQRLHQPADTVAIQKQIDQQANTIIAANPAVKGPIEQFIRERVKTATDPQRVFNALLAIIGGFVPGAAQTVAVIQALNILFSQRVAVEDFQYKPKP